jgi:hypothetical protein
MHTFQKTFDTLKKNLMSIRNGVDLLKTDLDRAIEQTCGPLGTFGKYEQFKVIMKSNTRLFNILKEIMEN